jgi:hypothetical protein
MLAVKIVAVKIAARVENKFFITTGLQKMIGLKHPIVNDNKKKRGLHRAFVKIFFAVLFRRFGQILRDDPIYVLFQQERRVPLNETAGALSMI